MFITSRAMISSKFRQTPGSTRTAASFKSRERKRSHQTNSPLCEKDHTCWHNFGDRCIIVFRECAFCIREATKETGWIQPGKRGSARKCGDEKHGEWCLVGEGHRHGQENDQAAR